MRKTIILSISLVCLAFCCLGQTTAGSEKGWPQDVEGLIEHLNTWDREELDVYERPQQYPSRKASGETNGWIASHKERLLALDAKVSWNEKKKIYELESNESLIKVKL